MSSRRTSGSAWTRVGLRALAVGILLAGVAGGLYVGQDRLGREDRAADRAALTAAAAASEAELLANLEEQRRESSERSARAEAERKAAVAAQNAAEQGRRAEKAVQEKAATQTGTTGGGSSGGSTKPYTGPIPASCNEYSGNRKIGCALMIDRGYPISEFPCLDKLWTKESGWNHRARNSSSGAYGIPQALPGSKMGSVADDWETNPATQIKWGLGYIKDRYGTPCDAWAHSQSTGWY